MRRVWWFLLLLGVAYSVEVTGGHISEVNIIRSIPLEDSPWLGVYGLIAPETGKRHWTYYVTPLGYFDLSPPTSETVVAGVSGSPSYVGDMNNWYVLVSVYNDVNLYDLDPACGVNPDPYFEGNFTRFFPRETYAVEENVQVNGITYCALRADTPTYTYFLLDDNRPVVLSPLRTFLMEGNLWNFSLLLSLNTTTRYYMYLVREVPYCGDLVCDPGEENCSDCQLLDIVVTPVARDGNIGSPSSFTVTITNYGPSVDVNLSLEVISGEVTYTFSSNPVSVNTLSSSSVTLSVVPQSEGTHTLRVRGNGIPSNVFYVVVRVTEEEEEVGGGGGGGGGGITEENVLVEENEVPVRVAGGYYIPWLDCTSSIFIFAPDEVEVPLDGNVSVVYIVRNSGSCVENIVTGVRGLPEGMVEVEDNTFYLSPGNSKRVVAIFFGRRGGTFEGVIFATGYYTAEKKIGVVVSGDVVTSETGCESSVSIVAPEEVEQPEGEEWNTLVVVENLGTCTERVDIKLYRLGPTGELLVDGRDSVIPPGERLEYTPPSLSAGDYVLRVTVDGRRDEVRIRVTPRGIVGGVNELITTSGSIVILIILLILAAIISYLRYRYLS